MLSDIFYTFIFVRCVCGLKRVYFVEFYMPITISVSLSMTTILQKTFSSSLLRSFISLFKFFYIPFYSINASCIYLFACLLLHSTKPSTSVIYLINFGIPCLRFCLYYNTLHIPFISLHLILSSSS